MGGYAVTSRFRLPDKLEQFARLRLMRQARACASLSATQDVEYG